jgi:hypothetical protein
VIGLTAWPSTRVLNRSEPAPTAFAAPTNMLRREIELDIVISLPAARLRHPACATFDRTRRAASTVLMETSGLIAGALVSIAGAQRPPQAAG